MAGSLLLTDKVQVIRGNVPSKSNSYRIIQIGGHGSLCKTDAMKRYEQYFMLQCGHYKDRNMQGLFRIDVDVYFPSMAHDLDNAMKVILDCLQQCKAIRNDNRCVELHARKFIDKEDPRIEFTIEEIC